jgi:hypothetical protein
MIDKCGFESIRMKKLESMRKLELKKVIVDEIVIG